MPHFKVRTQAASSPILVPLPPPLPRPFTSNSPPLNPTISKCTTLFFFFFSFFRVGGKEKKKTKKTPPQTPPPRHKFTQQNVSKAAIPRLPHNNSVPVLAQTNIKGKERGKEKGKKNKENTLLNAFAVVIEAPLPTFRYPIPQPRKKKQKETKLQRVFF